jgi:hypothetical protein
VEFKEQMSLVTFRASKIANEDWALGPLAPRRDVGKDGEHYGTMSDEMLRGAPPALPWQLPRRNWGERRNVYRVGDHAVVIRGKDKGSVAEIIQTDERSQTAVLLETRMARILPNSN